MLGGLVQRLCLLQELLHGVLEQLGLLICDIIERDQCGIVSATEIIYRRGGFGVFIVLNHLLGAFESFAQSLLLILNQAYWLLVIELLSL